MMHLQKLNPQNCGCDLRSKKEIGYKRLADKKHLLCGKLMKTDCEVTSLLNSDRDAMKSVCKTDCEDRNLPNTQCGLLKEMNGSIKSVIAAIFDLKDPIKFRYSAMELYPTIQPAETDLLKTSEIYSFWDKPFTGNSEYMDNISKIGLNNMRNEQQYLNPLPSSKRKFDGCNL